MKGEDTGGAYTLFEANLPPMDIGPPPHIHRNEDVAFYIVEGRFRFSLEVKEFKAGPGDFVFLPRGLKHWLRNESNTIGKMLVISNPAGLKGSTTRREFRWRTTRKCRPLPRSKSSRD
jgi:mannose-6-phosphate isomerase-like protein (cupin superfamily)